MYFGITRMGSKIVMLKSLDFRVTWGKNLDKTLSIKKIGSKVYACKKNRLEFVMIIINKSTVSLCQSVFKR